MLDKLKILVIFLILILASCKTNTSDFCLIYTPVMGYSTIKDVDISVYNQIKINNLKYIDFCE